MSKLKFLFGNHNHQPVGNFDHVFQHAVDVSYRPFLQVLKVFPDIRMSMHISGCLLEWLEMNDPALLDEVADLIKSGQLEMLSSGFYEPVLSAIPRHDRKNQLQKMNDFMQRRFGSSPAGAWMTERVWESHIVNDLLDAGLEYVVIDDYHFKCAGLTEEIINGYYLTENDGRMLKLFPIREKLRYAIPFQTPEETVQILRDYYDDGQRMIVMMDDGEKFGLWPGTADLCYKKGWLKRFFTELLANSEWLELATPQDILADTRPGGTVYLPSASYFEMSEWSLPGEQAKVFSDIVHELQDNGQIERYRPYLRGAIWRNFFAKYPESNNMHKRMLNLSNRIEAMQNSDGIEQAKTELLRAQCNCAYWHGVFGGLYLPHLRDAIYHHLIAAEIITDRIEYRSSGPKLLLDDYNCDGHDEAKFRTEILTAIFTPLFGGALYELDFKPKKLNLLNTLASRYEGYHDKILDQAESSQPDGESASIHSISRNVDENMRNKLHYDWHNRYSFLDHFLPSGIRLDELEGKTYRDLGDFVNQPYELSIEGDAALLSRNGHIFLDEKAQQARIEKRISACDGQLIVQYTLKYHGLAECHCLFAPELNFAMLGGDDDEIGYVSGSWAKQKMTSSGKRNGPKEFAIEDRRKGLMVHITTDKEADFFYYPAQTVSQSESGFELNYQSSVVMPNWSVFMQPDAEHVFTIIVECTQI